MGAPLFSLRFLFPDTRALWALHSPWAPALFQDARLPVPPSRPCGGSSCAEGGTGFPRTGRPWGRYRARLIDECKERRGYLVRGVWMRAQTRPEHLQASRALPFDLKPSLCSLPAFPLSPESLSLFSNNLFLKALCTVRLNKGDSLHAGVPDFTEHSRLLLLKVQRCSTRRCRSSSTPQTCTVGICVLTSPGTTPLEP